MEAPPHDFASLAIIVTDWDSLYAKKVSSSSTATTNSGSPPALDSFQQRSETGISDVVDEIWNLVSKTLRNRLREACIGVLRRTDSVDVTQAYYLLDEDARLLD